MYETSPQYLEIFEKVKWFFLGEIKIHMKKGNGFLVLTGTIFSKISTHLQKKLNLFKDTYIYIYIYIYYLRAFSKKKKKKKIVI